jgi:radical SAM protein with 4Fe4S-binding SPASM domain
MKMKIPFVVYEITPRCNLSCKYCYNIWKMPEGKMPETSSFGQVKRTLNRLFKIADVDAITFSGGEPFLFARLLELVLFCRMKNKQMVVISNGTNGHLQDYEALIRTGVGLFEFPVHSHDPGEHDRLAGRAGSWEKSVQSVKRVLSLGGAAVAVIVITRLNYRSVPETLRFIKTLGIGRVMLNRFNLGGQGITEHGNIGLTNAELKQAFSMANRTTAETALSVTSNVCTPFCVLNPEDYPNIGFSACYPKEVNRSWALDPHGNIRFCNHSPRVVGNIYRNTFEDFLKTDYIREWRETVPDVCKDCVLYERCWAGCRAASEQLGFPLSHADPIVYRNMT